VTEGKREHCRLVHNSKQAWVSLAWTLALLGFGYAPLVVEIAGTDEPWLWVVLPPSVLPTIWCGWRMSRVGVRVCANEARIVTMRKTIVVPWTEIDRFEVGASTLAAIIGIAHLRSGERIVIWGLAGPPNPATLIEELNAELRQPTAGPAATPGRPHAARGAAG
jgi:hypothetical protein